MEGSAAKKNCHVCGADVTHASRHKNSYGEYVCSDCFEAKRQTTRRHPHDRHTGKRVRQFIVYAILAAVGSWLFFEAISILSQLHDEQ
jgi:hypothetical protein